MSVTSKGSKVIAVFSGLITTIAVNPALGAPTQEPKPTLVSITPVQGPLDTKVTLKGSGFLAPGTELLIDGDGVADSTHPLSPLNDSTVELSFPAAIMKKRFWGTSGTAGSPGRSGPAPPSRAWVWPGRHSISIRNSNGLSNSVDFTVLGTAAIDLDSPAPPAGAPTITRGSGVPTITGSATGLSSINLDFHKLGDARGTRYCLDSPIPVVNGRWSIRLSNQKSWGNSNPLPLQPGMYAVSLFDVRTKYPLHTVYLKINPY
jgi:hypothetical protein